MQPLTFSCPLCGRRMGVGGELTGRPVRCPHCKQVVVAPSAAGGPTGGPVLPPSPPPPRREGAESIFADPGHDDDESVFETTRPVPPPLPTDDDSHDAPVRDADTPVPALDLRPPPAAVPPADAANAWAKIDDPDPAAPLVRPPAPTLVAAVAPPRRRLLVWGLIAYALLATGLAVWGWLRGGDRGHPLLFVPDFFGEYRKAARDKVSGGAYAPPDAPVPDHLRVRLGGSLAVGDLTVEPLSVTETRPTRVTVFAGNYPPQKSPTKQPCLVLKLRVRNTSAAVSFHPLDPAYLRKDKPGDPPPLTAVELPGGKQFPGGPVYWPFGSGYARIFMDGQDADDQPLPPGRQRESVVVSADSQELVDAVRASPGPVLWRIHVRRGVTRLRWQDVSVGAVVGVVFDPQEVARP